MAVAFDTNASNLTGSQIASPDTYTWTHTFGSSSANLIVVWIEWFTTTGLTLSSTTRSVTVGGQTCSFGGVAVTGGGTNTGNNVVEAYYLLNPPTSPLGQTVSVTLTGSGGTFSGVGESVSYTGVASVGTAVTNTGSSVSPSSGAVTSATGHLVAQCFGVNTATALTAYSGTSRFNNSSNPVGTIAGGDAAGASSVTVTGTIATNPWASVAFDMVPAGAAPAGPTKVIIPNRFVGPMALRHNKRQPYVPYRNAPTSQSFSDGANSTWTFTTSTDGHRGITDAANSTWTFTTSTNGRRGITDGANQPLVFSFLDTEFVDHPGAKTRVIVPNRFVGPQALRHNKRPPYVASQKQGFTDAANQAITFTTSTNGHRGITDAANSTWIFTPSTNGHRGITDVANATWTFSRSTNGHRGITDSANQTIVFTTSTGGVRGVRDGANTVIVFTTPGDGFVDRPRFTPLIIPNPHVGPMALRNRKRMPYVPYRLLGTVGPQNLSDGANSTWVFTTTDNGHRGITAGANATIVFTDTAAGRRGVRDGANITVTASFTNAGRLGIRDGANLSLVFATSDDGTIHPFLIDVAGTVVVGPSEIRSVTLPAAVFSAILPASEFSVTLPAEDFSVTLPTPIWNTIVDGLE